MKICLVNRSDIDGGASIGAYRLHQSLLQAGVDSRMLVGKKLTNDTTVFTLNKQDRLWLKLAGKLDSFPQLFYPNRENLIFSSQYLPDRIVPKINQIAPDIINLHWINGGYIKIETIRKFNRPLVWTFRDMWGFTGGCHYTGNCERYINSCGYCPQLHSTADKDLSRWVWERKAKAWKDINLTIVAISSWLANCISESSLFKDVRVEIIHNGIDTKKYQPMNKKTVREILQLPQDKKLILFGAISPTKDKRKGFHLLASALNYLSQSSWKDKIEIVIFGSSEPKNPIDLGFRTHYLGYINNDSDLAHIYSAVDVMIVPSIQEAFGKTAIESLACGTPVVSFDSTGLKDIVEHQENGYRAECFSCDDLARGIVWILENPNRYNRLSHRARQKVEQEFSLELQASRYLKLFNEIIFN